MQQFDPNAEYQYVGERVQIGTGFGGMKPVAQNGIVAITKEGSVLLFDSKGAIIDQAPLSEASTKSIPLVGGQSVFLFLGKQRYSVSVNSIAGNVASGNLYPGAVAPFAAHQSTAGFVQVLSDLKA